MQFVYTADGAEKKAWNVDVTKMLNVEAEAIERVTKMTFGEWAKALQNESVVAIHALLWVLLKREMPTLRYDQVEFSINEVDFELTDDETLEAVEQLDRRAAAGEEFPEDVAELYERLSESAKRIRAERGPGPLGPEPEVDDQIGQVHGGLDASWPAEGKASETSATSTDGSSLTSSTPLPPSLTV